MSDRASLEAVVITTTAASLDAAEALAVRLVENRLAACVQIAPITSLYAWEGKTTRAAEYLLTIKTRASLFPVIEAAVRANHDYAVPEIIAVAVTDISADYLAWLLDATESS